MLKTLLLATIFISTSPLFGQTRHNPNLKRELDSLFKKDQSLRDLLNSDLLQTKADSLASAFGVAPGELLNHIIKTIPVIDSTNLERIQQIIRRYGYPGKSLVGEGTNEAAFFIIQHSKLIDKYLPIIKNAASKKELSFTLYAMMLDRSLMYKGQEQIYGTQGKGMQVVNKTTGQNEFKTIIWPIRDPNQVNSRRKKAGFTTTVEQYAEQELGITYKVVTLEEVKKMASPN